ncbi:MAG: ATP-binding protein [Candidatus Roizmanbacteria bacterium]|nr:ATP-binding protein [Candidatus Roizmanbacteria bacterium]
MTTSLHRQFVAVGGPKGSGKSAVLKQALSILPGFKIISFGNWLMKQSRQELHADFPDLDIQNKNILRKKFEKEIISLTRSYQVILDMHFGEFEEGGYPCVVPKTLEQRFTHIVLLTASASAIQQRRLNDHKERRIDLISIHLNILGERLLYNNLCKKSHVKHSVFLNNDLDKTTRELVQFLSN